MRLAQLLEDVEVLSVDGLPADGDPTAVDITSVVHDSRSVGPGALFCCVVGSTVDGHDLAPAAVEAGAVALLCDRPVDVAVPQIRVHDVRAGMGVVAAALHGHPSRHMDVIGITGTNGKTTTAHLLAAVLEAAGRPAGVIGTLTSVPGNPPTTPDAPELQARLAALREGGTAAVAMEVSSHALDQRRVSGTRFAVAVFTNLSQDHLDHHGTMEAYFAAKARLFEPELSAAAVVNVDDPHGRLLHDAALVPTEAFSLGDATDVQADLSGTTFTWRGERLHLPLPGAFNLANALAAATAAAALGVGTAAIGRGLAGVTQPAGRFEVVAPGSPVAVVVDYAHTPDSLAQLLDGVRELSGAARVHVVFGCGGDKDRAKRPMMGDVAARLADHVVVTSDNPRSEDPLAIIAEVVAGIDAATARAELEREPDRRAAIERALRAAAPGDVVVIAGKGHETTQLIGGAEHPFDDRIVATEVLAELGVSPEPFPCDKDGDP